MNLKFSIAIKFLCIVLLSIACQKGKKVESNATVYKDSLKACEQLSDDLSNEGIDLNSTATFNKLNSDKNKEFPQFTKKQQKEPLFTQVKNQLEDFVVAAEKLTNLADEKVVVFQEKARIQKQLKIAAAFLAQIYSNVRWNMSDTYFVSKEVDYLESEIRLKRNSYNLTVIRDMGLPYGGNDQKNLKPIGKIKSANLARAKNSAEALQIDFMRIKNLAERNSYWNSEGIKILADSAEKMGGYYYQLEQVLIAELDKRNNR
jgi:hypothetical protein